ncbi:guanylate kinase [Desulfovibrio sp. OttesenSCG-928-C14]|nr:guanylate kinase [Desulfovibrio sp. OttesenSCG-928-C14]
MDKYTRQGTAFVLCAPSGAGKTTLARRLIARYPSLGFSVSCTTRAPRAGEVEGRDYYFINKDDFLEKIRQGFFAEWAEVHGNFYGTPMKEVRALLAKGVDLLFDIDVQGAAQLKQTVPEAFFTFILPPSRAVLEQRLRGRETDSEESVLLRLANAAREIREASWFNSWIINDDLDHAFAELVAVYEAARLSPARVPGFLDELLAQF